MTEMNSKERVLATLEGRLPDRVPILTFGIDPIFLKKAGFNSIGKALQVLELDVYPVFIQNWCQDIPMSASLSREIPEEMQTSSGLFGGWHGIDEFGRVWERGSYVGGVVRTDEDIEKYVPDLILEARAEPGRIRSMIDYYPDKAFGLMSHTGPFGLTMESIGFEEFLYMYMDKRDFIKKLLWKRTEWFAEIAKYGAQLGCDFIIMGDDVAFKGKTFISPQDFRELMVPCYQHIVKNAGIPVIWHSDGFITPCLNTAVESGLAGVHSLEPSAGVDLGEVKKAYGDKLVLVGNVDIGVLCHHDLDKVRQEVQRCMNQAKENARYILSDANSIHNGCYPQAVKEMFRFAREIGSY